MSAATGHRAIDHTADLAIEVWAPDEPALLEQALRALSEILMDGPPPAAPACRRTMTLATLDAEDRMVRWLGELLYWATDEGFVATGAEVTLRADGLDATVVGAALPIANEIKAVTYHDLHVGGDGTGWRAQVVFDV